MMRLYASPQRWLMLCGPCLCSSWQQVSIVLAVSHCHKKPSCSEAHGSTIEPCLGILLSGGTHAFDQDSQAFPWCQGVCFGPTHLQLANGKAGLYLCSAGDAHSAALTSNGFLFMWGSNEKGQLGLPAAADVAAQASVRPPPDSADSVQRNSVCIGSLTACAYT